MKMTPPNTSLSWKTCDEDGVGNYFTIMETL